MTELTPPIVDLRSDTVTKPSPAMREAMMDAEVGDDVLDGDPTTHQLEAAIASRLGMDAALFFPSGIQANQAAMWLHTRPGTEVLLEADSHMVHYEMAALAALAGVQIRPVSTTDGLLTADLAQASMRPSTWYMPEISAAVVENSHNLSGGRVMPLAVWDDLVTFAREAGLPLHLDGARVWNAAAALGVPVERIVRGATSVMVSFSKGLGCPVGSCLVGERAFIRRARAVRRRLGGAMRQTGILAAAALYALEHNATRLEQDHRHATLFAGRFGDTPGVTLVPPETNIVLLDLEEGDALDVEARLAARGVLVVRTGRRQLRAVTHLDVTRDDVELAADTMLDVLAT